MTNQLEALKIIAAPARTDRNWSMAVMRTCDLCDHHKNTVLNDDGSAMCASCCDSEYTANVEYALEKAIENNAALIAALEQSQQTTAHLSGQRDEWERKAISNFEECGKMSARIERLEASQIVADKLQDSSFRHGLQCGFSYGQTNDQAGFEMTMKAYSNIHAAGITVQEDE